jgi:hypothetical protein
MQERGDGHTTKDEQRHTDNPEHNARHRRGSHCWLE